MIICGDALAELKKLPDASVNCCVTSPPYFGLRDYGISGQMGLETSPEEYVAKMVEIFREVRRVLRDDGTLWLNMGDTYGTGTRADRRPGNKGLGVATAAAQGIPRHGGAAKQLMGMPWRLAFALQADGWYLRSDIIWHKPNPMPESVKDRPTKAHEYIFLLSKAQRYYYDAVAIREDRVSNGQETGVGFGHGTDKTARGRARVFSGNKEWKTPDGWDTSKGNGGHGSYHREGREDGRTGYVHKSGNKERKLGSARGRPDSHLGASIPWSDVDGKRNRRTVWTIPTKPYKGAHFATFPPALIEPCILAGCPEGGVVLDPFFGAGTTGFVAMKNSREFIGIELNPEYCVMAQKRIHGGLF